MAARLASASSSSSSSSSSGGSKRAKGDAAAAANQGQGNDDDLRAQMRERLTKVLTQARVKLVKDKLDKVGDGEESVAAAAANAAQTAHWLDPALVALETEDAAFKACSSKCDSSYKKKMRSLLSNAKATTRSKLASGLLTGSLLAPAAVRMSNRELATDDVRQAADSNRRAAIQSTVIDPMAGAIESSAYTCPQCSCSKTRARDLTARRDIAKAEVWGVSDDAGTHKVRIQCLQCKHEWVAEVSM